ncbi:MAG: 16S rRNA (uracil(1498)-N(3))-methyltransferase [Kiritimatiellae bacterium]|nr:16S rRNA (uracil(1498)-N(3))-methyltransferase [Kiritimatiellia bacterium]
MIRCFVEPSALPEPEIVIRGEEAHHLLHVRRVAADGNVTLFDGQGNQALAEISAVRKREVCVRVLSRRTTARPAPRLALVQAVPKGPSMDLIVQKATELGIAAIQPVLSARGVVHLDRRQAPKRHARWLRIAVNAAKQSGVLWLPDVRPVRPLAELLAGPPPCDTGFMASLAPGARPFRSAVDEARKGRPGRVALLIGPEGDFTPGETADANRAGWIPVSLGPAVLRVETAALFGLSLLVYEFARNPEAGDRRSALNGAPSGADG